MYKRQLLISRIFLQPDGGQFPIRRIKFITLSLLYIPMYFGLTSRMWISQRKRLSRSWIFFPVKRMREILPKSLSLQNLSSSWESNSMGFTLIKKMKCTLTTLRKGASLQNKQTVSTFVTKTEYTYIQQMYLKLFGKSFLFTKKVNWKKYSYPLFYLL